MSAMMFDGTPPAPKREKKPKIRKHYPWWKRIHYYCWKAVRVVFVLSMLAVWKVAKPWLRDPLIFAVYGTAKDQRAYWPTWLDWLMPSVFPIGLIRYGKRKGMIVASKVSVEEFDKNPALALDYVKDIKREFPHAQAVALAGRLPGWVFKAGGEIEAPFVNGSLGTRYAMMCAVKECAAKRKVTAKHLVLALLGGAGHTGSQVVGDTAKIFGRVIALDPRFNDQQVANHEQEICRKNDNVVQTSNQKMLAMADVVLVLTASGNDIADSVKYFSPGTVLADDTHPCIKRIIRSKLVEDGVDLWKAVMYDGQLRMIPRMPNFKPDDIPGCLLEALVVLEHGQEVLSNLECFSKAADKTSIRARLIRHPDDS